MVNLKLISVLLMGLVALESANSVAPTAMGQQNLPAQKVPRLKKNKVREGVAARDLSKSIIELPVEMALGEKPPVQEGIKKVLAADAGLSFPSKMKIESGTRELLAAEVRNRADALTRGDEAENPHVAPGGVFWHGSFEAACDAASESGKPVLLFHLLGQLDQRFT